eukprot:14911174-Ditylum_brightwellii.AAC.1
MVKAMAESVQHALAANDERKSTETAPQIVELQSQLTKMRTLLSSMQQAQQYPITAANAVAQQGFQPMMQPFTNITN